ncbi:MAG: hypothetical protein ACYTET_02355 [Planctomycetota bacterium]|jgi:hypothetical protein
MMEIIDLQVNNGALVTLRTHLRSFIEERYGELVQVDLREWGNMKIAFFEKQEQPEMLEIDP